MRCKCCSTGPTIIDGLCPNCSRPAFKRPLEMRDGPFNDEVACISDELYNYIVKLEKLYEELYEIHKLSDTTT